MDESSEKPVKPKKFRYFTVVKSSYSLRKTLARSESKPSTSSIETSIPQQSISPDLSKYQVTETPRSLPSSYPSRIRVSAVNNPPFSTSKDSPIETPNEERSEPQRRVDRILQGFRETYDKLVEEEKLNKNKRSGEKLRLDLAAYNLYKEKNKHFYNATRAFGSIPGVKIGDKFHFIVELFLTGLHIQLKNIDFMKRDERLFAVSIVSVTYLGHRDNSVSELKSSYSLVCRGRGKKKRDQRMEGGNLALKNSIAGDTPVRVILGFRDGKNKEVTYVYSGLYSVEKYWTKKDKYNCVVFMFEMKRLPNQAKLDIAEVRKKIWLRIHSNDSRRDFSPFESTNKRADSLNFETCVEGVPVKVLGKRERVKEEDSQAECWKRVKQTLNDFHFIYCKLLEEDETKKKKEVGEGSKIILNAYKLLKENNKDLSKISRRLGDIPGLEIGDKFHFRVELSLAGVHCHLQADIDYIRKEEKLLAVSIVSVRLQQYNSKPCNSDILLFCGSGMKNRDQKMVNGNLALKNNIEAKTPIRVVHGFRNKKKAVVYIYLGLYSALKYWRKKDNNGHYVFTFLLKRLPEQQKLNIKDAKKSTSLRAHSAPNNPQDVSQGKERVPIRVVNTIDDKQIPPFKYITEVIRPLNYIPIPLEGCNCVNGCSDSDTCACAVRNGGELPFNSMGSIVEAKPLVYACGPLCNCPPSCHNRVSQRGIKFPLQVFKTKTMGWGVRSRTFIPSGSYICEYFGELLDDEEAQKRTTDEYLFAIGNNYHDDSLWEGLSSVPCLQKSALSEAEEDGGFTLDGSKYGNVGRFINHSCTPNLYAQNLLYDHDDKRMPHVMFFACEDIPPMQELTYHYNYTIDEVFDSEGNIRKKVCYCGSIECTGRLY